MHIANYQICIHFNPLKQLTCDLDGPKTMLNMKYSTPIQVS